MVPVTPAQESTVTKLKRYADIARRIIGYLIALFLTLMFALFMSARTGWFLFSVMAMLPFVSVIAAFIVRRYITVTAEVTDTELFKGNCIRLRLTVNNRAWFPSPPIILKQHCSDGLVCAENGSELAVNVLPRSEGVFETEYRAVMWSYSRVGLEDAFITDYTGMIKMRLPSIAGTVNTFAVKIIPDIKDISSSQEILKAADEAAAGSDDNEDTADVRAVGFTGVPGYEHRSYEPGDPLKRINWKLSAKRDSLMVRLDDSILSKKHSVILDCSNTSGNARYGEICGETMLGILSVIIRSGYECTAWYRSGGVWVDSEVNDEMSLERLRLELAGYRFTEAKERIPYRELSELPGGAGAVIFFTPCIDAALSDQLVHSGVYSKSDISVTPAAASAGAGVSASGVWMIAPDGTMEML